MRTSKGEQKVIDLLKREGKSFRREVTFPDLKSLKGKPLRFDFAVYEGGSLAYIIEYDGEHHFHPEIRPSQFAYSAEMDVRKNSYCLRKKIPLYRIPYFDYGKISRLSDILVTQYLVDNKWWNHRIRHRLP